MDVDYVPTVEWIDVICSQWDSIEMSKSLRPCTDWFRSSSAKDSLNKLKERSHSPQQTLWNPIASESSMSPKTSNLCKKKEQHSSVDMRTNTLQPYKGQKWGKPSQIRTKDLNRWWPNTISTLYMHFLRTGPMPRTRIKLNKLKKMNTPCQIQTQWVKPL